MKKIIFFIIILTSLISCSLFNEPPIYISLDKSRSAGTIYDSFILTADVMDFDSSKFDYSWYINDNLFIKNSNVRDNKNSITTKFSKLGVYKVFVEVLDYNNIISSDKRQIVIYPYWLSGSWSNTVKISSVDTENYYFDDEISLQYQDPNYHYITVLKYDFYTMEYYLDVLEANESIFKFKYKYYLSDKDYDGWLKFEKIDDYSLNLYHAFNDGYSENVYGPFKYLKN